MRLFVCLLIIALTSVFADESNEDRRNSYLENYYCGEHNCYDLLQVTRDSSKADIKRNFRQIASKTHPDKFLDPEKKEIALNKFTLLQRAYDILRDEEARSDYDYFLDNPEEFMMNYYRAWRRRLAPKVDIRLVLAVTISLISLVQYYSGWSKYDEAISFFASQPKYRNQALEIAREEGMLSSDNNNKNKRAKGVSKEEMRKKEQEVIRQVIENKMDIRGVYAKPTIRDILWIQIFLLPMWIVEYFIWYGKWIWKFTILRNEYGDEEKFHIIRKNMSMSAGQFDALEEHIKEDYLRLELWKSDKFKNWKERRDAKIKAEQMSSGRYKAYKRYLKKHGPDRMYFDE